jgi:hypothetical protein
MGKGFDAVEHVVTFGLEHRTPKIVFVCSDMWEPC